MAVAAPQPSGTSQPAVERLPLSTTGMPVAPSWKELPAKWTACWRKVVSLLSPSFAREAVLKTEAKKNIQTPWLWSSEFLWFSAFANCHVGAWLGIVQLFSNTRWWNMWWKVQHPSHLACINLHCLLFSFYRFQATFFQQIFQLLRIEPWQNVSRIRHIIQALVCTSAIKHINSCL